MMAEPKVQDEIFNSGEGDSYFERNKHKISGKPENEKREQYLSGDRPLAMLGQYGISPKGVIEIGCANGFRLDKIKKAYPGCAKAVGLEPSERAIEDAKANFPDIRVVKGVASSIPFKDGEFDLAITYFVLHWIDRKTLLKSIAEIDRVICENGYLLIGDFNPDSAIKVRYHHLKDKEVYTYKTDYAKMFLSTGNYTLVASMAYDHESRGLAPDVKEMERAVCVLLRKNTSEFYRETAREIPQPNAKK